MSSFNKSPMDPLELRIKAFIDGTSRLINLPIQYKQEYEMHFREHISLTESEGEDYSSIIAEVPGIFDRTIQDARTRTPEQLYKDLEGYAATFAFVFSAREHALKNPILRKAFVKIVPRK